MEKRTEGKSNVRRLKTFVSKHLGKVDVSPLHLHHSPCQTNELQFTHHVEHYTVGIKYYVLCCSVGSSLKYQFSNFEHSSLIKVYVTFI